MQWVMAATLVCGLSLMASCKSDSDETPVTPPETPGKLVTLPPGVVSKGYTMQTIKVLKTTTGERVFYDKQNVQVAFDGKDVYVAGFSPSFPESFVKGTLTDAGTCLFKSGQYVGEDKDGEKYVIGMNTETEVTDLEFSFDPEMRILTLPVASEDPEDSEVPGSLFIAESADSLTPHLTPNSPIIQSITVMPGTFKEQPFVTLPEGLTTEQWYITGSDDQEYSLNYGVTIAFDGQDVYLQGLLKDLPLAWVHGRLEGGVITIKKGQFVGYYKEWQEVLLVGYDDDEVIDDITLTYDADKRIMENDNTIGFYGIDKQKVEYGFSYAYITKERYIIPDPTLPPAGISASPYRFEYESLVKADEGDSLVKDVDGIEEVFICFDGNDVYLKFLYDANGWSKGTFSPDHRTITIPSLQYFGSFLREGFPREDYYITGLVEKDNGKFELTDVILDYDAQQGIISTSNTVCINTSYRTYNPYVGLTYRNLVFTKKKEVAATPSAPEVDVNYNSNDSKIALVLTIPLVTDDGTDLLTDKLSYICYYEKDGQQHEMVFRAADYKGLETDMVEIPYNFDTDKIVRTGADIWLSQPFDELLTWTKIGAKVIYRGGGEEHSSAITWFDAKAFYEEHELLK
jgi:hypothetical protein